MNTVYMCETDNYSHSDMTDLCIMKKLNWFNLLISVLETKQSSVFLFFLVNLFKVMVEIASDLEYFFSSNKVEK